MTRIVAGRARGRRLVVPSDGTRPTSDRAREAVFSSLESSRGPWQGASVLDLYAGSGACGLEAASRGAARVDLVDAERAAVRAITTNLDAVLQSGVDARVQVHQATARHWTDSPPKGTQYDVVFCDPPYATAIDEVAAVLRALVASHALTDDAMVVLERSSHDADWQWASPFENRWDRRYGEAHLWVAVVGVGKIA